MKMEGPFLQATRDARVGVEVLESEQDIFLLGSSEAIFRALEMSVVLEDRIPYGTSHRQPAFQMRERLGGVQALHEGSYRTTLRVSAHHDVADSEGLDCELYRRRGGIGAPGGIGRGNDVSDILYHKEVPGLALRNELGKHP